MIDNKHKHHIVTKFSCGCGHDIDLEALQPTLINSDKELGIDRMVYICPSCNEEVRKIFVKRKVNAVR